MIDWDKTKIGDKVIDKETNRAFKIIEKGLLGVRMECLGNGSFFNYDKDVFLKYFKPMLDEQDKKVAEIVHGKGKTKTTMEALGYEINNDKIFDDLRVGDVLCKAEAPYDLRYRYTIVAKREDEIDIKPVGVEEKTFQFIVYKRSQMADFIKEFRVIMDIRIKRQELFDAVKDWGLYKNKKDGHIWRVVFKGSNYFKLGINEDIKGIVPVTVGLSNIEDFWDEYDYVDECNYKISKELLEKREKIKDDGSLSGMFVKPQDLEWGFGEVISEIHLLKEFLDERTSAMFSELAEDIQRLKNTVVQDIENCEVCLIKHVNEKTKKLKDVIIDEITGHFDQQLKEKLNEIRVKTFETRNWVESNNVAINGRARENYAKLKCINEKFDELISVCNKGDILDEKKEEPEKRKFKKGDKIIHKPTGTEWKVREVIEGSGLDLMIIEDEKSTMGIIGNLSGEFELSKNFDEKLI